MNRPEAKQISELQEAYFCREFSRLNPRQQEAIFAASGPVLILAGAGSGKTTVLVERIRSLLTYGDGPEHDFQFPEAVQARIKADLAMETMPEEEQAFLRAAMSHDPVKPWKILAITFTNKAARELKDRIIAKTGSAGESIWACTFHSACLRMLRSHITLLDYPSSFTIYDTDDQLRLMKKILAEEQIDEKIFPPKQMLSRIGRLKDRLITPEAFSAKLSANFQERMLARVYPIYQARLKKAGAVDFDDIITLTVELLTRFPEVLEKYQRQFTHILVDEYQDTNQAQFELVRLLSAKSRNLCVVGDDDQSIYKFRGATIENILSFEEQYPDCRVIRLEENYRSTPAILDAANRIIAHNRNRKGKTLWTARKTEEKVKMVQVANDLNEGNYIAGIIRKDVADGMKYSDHAVLYRMNAQSNSLERTFSALRIPYRVFGGQPFLGRKEIKDVRAYLCLVLNPHDDERLLRVINEPKRSIGATSMEKLQELAKQYDTSLFTIALRAEQFPIFSAKTAAALTGFARMILELQETWQTEELDVLYDRMLELSGYEMSLMSQGDEGMNRLENVKEFRSNIVDFMMREGKSPDLYEEEPTDENPATPLEKFLAETELSTDQDRAEDEDCVTLMTIHSAKGLEFPVVFLPGMEESIFPSSLSMESEEDLEEERRLAYVAVTRAKDKLYLLRAGQRLLFGRTVFNPVSRYVEEMGTGELEEINPDRREPTARPFASGSSWRSVSGANPYARPITASGTAVPIRSAGGQIPGMKQPMVSDAPTPNYRVGMLVTHPKFGDGQILSVTSAGNDQLVEIAFDRAGTKKIMAKLARMTIREDE